MKKYVLDVELLCWDDYYYSNNQEIELELSAEQFQALKLLEDQLSHKKQVGKMTVELSVREK